MQRAESPLAMAVEILLVLAGLDLVVAGVMGRCSLSRKLGYGPAALAR